jgi:hypothetical protein
VFLNTRMAFLRMFEKVAGSVTWSVTGLEYCRLAVQPSRWCRAGNDSDETQATIVYCLNVCQGGPRPCATRHITP